MKINYSKLNVGMEIRVEENSTEILNVCTPGNPGVIGSPTKAGILFVLYSTHSSYQGRTVTIFAWSLIPYMSPYGCLKSASMETSFLPMS